MMIMIITHSGDEFMVMVQDRAMMTFFSTGSPPPRMTICDVFCSGVDTFDIHDNIMALIDDDGNNCYENCD